MIDGGEPGCQGTTTPGNPGWQPPVPKSNECYERRVPADTAVNTEETHNMDTHIPLPAPHSTQRRHLPVGAVGAVFVLILAGFLILVLVGCGSSGPKEPPTSTTPPNPGPRTGTLARPGLYAVEGGRSHALGVLEYRDLEGGFWAVVDAMPGQSTDTAQLIAVLVGADKLGIDLEALKGHYVSADGTLAGGASSRMAGPELTVDTLKEVSDTVVVPSTNSAY